MREIIDKSYSVIEVNDVNKKALDDPKRFVSESEAYYNDQVMAAARRIKESNGRYKFILLCGPSASGKTTTAHKLKHRIVAQGLSSSVVSMDDFFMGMESYPLLPDGNPNMESVLAMDMDLLNSCFDELMNTGECMFPVFDFEKQKQKLKAKKMVLDSNHVLIMEGIHALNPSVLSNIPEENIFRMYVSVRAKFKSDNVEILEPSDIRLLRRMVRDFKFRNYAPLKTLEYWHNVRNNEKINIYPYRDNVDLKMDNTIDYEVCAWKGLLQQLLDENHKETIKGHPELLHIFEGLEKFENLDYDLIPNNSLLREFIGKNI